MLAGIIAGMTWALETVIIGIALGMSPFFSTEQAIFLAPFVSTFLHDACSAVWAFLYNAIRGNLKNVWKAFMTKSGKWVVAEAIIGGPVGMTGYVLAVNYMGASAGAVASAIYPAIGAVLAYVFLKEKIRWYQWIFLLCTLLGVWGLSASPDLAIKNLGIGLLGVFLCSFGWGTEGMILSKCMREKGIASGDALQLRQLVSALIYGFILLPCLKGWSFTAGLFSAAGIPVLATVAAAAFFATVSYLLYYRAIAALGTAKAMGLNITYTAWAMFFSVVLLRDTGVLKVRTIVCALLVVVCGVLAAVDLKELLKKEQTQR